MEITLKFNSRKTEQALERLQQHGPNAIRRALDRSIDSAKTAMVRVVAEDMGLKVSDVRERIYKHWTVNEHGALAVQLKASAKRLPLVDFNARGPEPSRGKGRGVTAKLTGGAGRYPHAFLATMKSGHRGVFQRQGTGRLPIYELFGPSIVRVFNKHAQVGVDRGREQLVKNLQSELRFALRQSSAPPTPIAA